MTVTSRIPPVGFVTLENKAVPICEREAIVADDTNSGASSDGPEAFAYTRAIVDVSQYKEKLLLCRSFLSLHHSLTDSFFPHLSFVAKKNSLCLSNRIVEETKLFCSDDPEAFAYTRAIVRVSQSQEKLLLWRSFLSPHHSLTDSFFPHLSFVAKKNSLCKSNRMFLLVIESRHSFLLLILTP
jgi:hypothetical protein